MNELARGAILSIVLTSVAVAQDPDAPQKPSVEPEVTVIAPEVAAGPNTGKLSLSGGVDWTTAYFFRGYNQEDTGLILQPWATIGAGLVEEEDFTVDAYVGIWNSVHGKKTGAASSPNSWYESDLYAGVDVGLGPVMIGGLWTYYTYPNDAFETIQELGLKLSLDDGAVLGERMPIALNPYAAAYAETSDGNGTQDMYGEVGITPGVDVGDDGATLSFPVFVGLSLDDFYIDADGDNEFLGFVSIGATAGIPLPVSGDYGDWTLIVGVQYIHLFADGLEAANDGGEDYELIGKVGVSFSY